MTFEELADLKYIQWHNDFFSIEDGMDYLSLGVINPENLNIGVRTNSEHMMTDFLLQTDVTEIGISRILPSIIFIK